MQMLRDEFLQLHLGFRSYGIQNRIKFLLHLIRYSRINVYFNIVEYISGRRALNLISRIIGIG